MCAAVLDCSRLLLIVAIEIAHAMLATQGSPHNAVHSSSDKRYALSTRLDCRRGKVAMCSRTAVSPWTD